MKKLKVILIGAGGRGTGYTDIMAQMPDKYEIVAVAEPIKERREYIRKKHNVPENMCFTTWEPLLDMGEQFGDVALSVIPHMGEQFGDVALSVTFVSLRTVWGRGTFCYICFIILIITPLEMPVARSNALLEIPTSSTSFFIN